MQSCIRLGHPVTFGALVVFSIIEMCISAFLTANDYTCRYILVLSVLTIICGTGFLTVFFLAPSSELGSVAAHYIFIALAWILWLAAAGEITSSGVKNCKSNFFEFAYCGQVWALGGLAWLICLLLMSMCVLVFNRSEAEMKRGYGFDGGLTEA